MKILISSLLSILVLSPKAFSGCSGGCSGGTDPHAQKMISNMEYVCQWMKNDPAYSDKWAACYDEYFDLATSVASENPSVWRITKAEANEIPEPKAAWTENRRIKIDHERTDKLSCEGHLIAAKQEMFILLGIGAERYENNSFPDSESYKKAQGRCPPADHIANEQTCMLNSQTVSSIMLKSANANIINPRQLFIGARLKKLTSNSNAVKLSVLANPIPGAVSPNLEIQAFPGEEVTMSRSTFLNNCRTESTSQTDAAVTETIRTQEDLGPR
jgi:hypothetical protein